MNLVEDFLATADPSDVPAELSSFRPGGTVLLSSRTETSRYATALLLDRDGRLAVVAKVARSRGHRQRLATELEILRFLAGRHTGQPAAPVPLALVEHRGHWLLLQTAVTGTALSRHKLARSQRHTWECVENWLLQLGSAGTIAGEAWHAEQIVDPLRRIEETLPATTDEKRLFAQTELLTHELAGSALPTPIEHGDLFRVHLRLEGEGSLAAIDWELGRLHGLAGADAVVFLIDLFRRPGGLAGEATARGYAADFLDARGLARQWLQDHLERQGVERSWVDHILLATLARRTLNVWEPVVTETYDAAEEHDGARSSFRNFWALQLWHMTAEHMTTRNASGL